MQDVPLSLLRPSWNAQPGSPSSRIVNIENPATDLQMAVDMTANDMVAKVVPKFRFP